MPPSAAAAASSRCIGSRDVEVNTPAPPLNPWRFRWRFRLVCFPFCGTARGENRGVDELIRQFYDDLWNRWDDELVDELLAEDFTFRGSLGTETRGRDEWRAYRDLVRAGAPDFHNEVVTLVVHNDHAAARLLYSGTHSGPLAGMPPSGRRFTYAGAAFFTAKSGQLASAWVLGDLAGLREQIRIRPGSIDGST
jgi:steroid delta-isomerase-like uncharacterized protein